MTNPESFKPKEETKEAVKAPEKTADLKTKVEGLKQVKSAEEQEKAKLLRKVIGQAITTTDEQEMKEYAKNSNEAVRMAVVRNPNVTDQVLKAMEQQEGNSPSGVAKLIAKKRLTGKV